jgi:hypothetical protein
MIRPTTRLRLGAAAVVLAALALTAPRTLSAQAADSAPAKEQAKDTAQASASQVTASTTVPRYLADHARALQLNAKQLDRVRKVAERLDSANAPLHTQWQQVTGGRPLRGMGPAQRRSLAPQLQPITQQLRANNEAALDSVDAILTPAQQQRLQTVLQEYRRRMQARRARQGQS